MAGLQEHRIRILLVDEPSGGDDLIGTTFKGSGYKLTRAATVDEARAHLQQAEFDAVLLDLPNAGEDATGLCAEMQDDPRLRCLIVFIFSAADEVSQRVIAFSLGADEYVLKPFNPFELRARLAAKLLKRSYYELATGVAVVENDDADAA